MASAMMYSFSSEISLMLYILHFTHCQRLMACDGIYYSFVIVNKSNYLGK